MRPFVCNRERTFAGWLSFKEGYRMSDLADRRRALNCWFLMLPRVRHVQFLGQALTKSRA